MPERVKIHWFTSRKNTDSYQWVTTACGVSDWNLDFTSDHIEHVTCRSCLLLCLRRVSKRLAENDTRD